MLVACYCNVLQTPHKELVWFNSGHGLGAEELRDGMVNHILAHTPPLR